MILFRTICIIQARLGSQRFPRKILAYLCGKPVLAHVVDRAKAIRGVDAVVVACPESDAETLDALGLGVPIVGVTIGGDENDVLSRFAATAEAYPANCYVRLTGDCPLLAPDLAEQVISRVRQGAFYACTRHDGWPFGWPDGMDIEAFTVGALLDADRDATDPADREHVTPHIRRNWLTVGVPCPAQWPAGAKLSIDTPADLDYARSVMVRLPTGAHGWEATYRAVIAAEAARERWQCRMS